MEGEWEMPTPLLSCAGWRTLRCFHARLSWMANVQAVFRGGWDNFQFFLSSRAAQTPRLGMAKDISQKPRWALHYFTLPFLVRPRERDRNTTRMLSRKGPFRKELETPTCTSIQNHLLGRRPKRNMCAVSRTLRHLS